MNIKIKLLSILLIIGVIFGISINSYAIDSLQINVKIKDYNGKNLVDESVSVNSNDSVLDITKKIFDENSIDYNVKNGRIISIEDSEIHNNSQWIFVVNDEEMGEIGAKDYYLEDGDLLEWIYIEIYEEIKEDELMSPYITGYSDGTFRPNNNLTREEAASVFFNILDEDMKMALKTDDHDFIDIEKGKWSEEAVATLNVLKIMSGYKDGSFKPSLNITRGEVAVILSRLYNLEDQEEMTFKDIDTYWGKDKIKKVAGKGWIKGYSDGTFRPEKNITRAEFISMINKSLGRTEKLEDITNIKNKFTDIDKDRWFFLDVFKASEEYIVSL